MAILFFFQLACLICYTPALVRCSQPGIGNPNDVDWTSIADLHGNQLPDFSFCGYHNSEIPLPTQHQQNTKIALPNGYYDDFSPQIQEAIDANAQNGGGIIQLPPGRINITAGIRLHGNVVLTGTGKRATTLVLKSQPSKPVFTLGSVGQDSQLILRATSLITNAYVPVGARTVDVTNTNSLRVGQDVYISRIVQEPWVRYNGMSDLVRYNQPQTWIPVRILVSLQPVDIYKTNRLQIGKRIMSPNQIKAINGTQITLKIPITDNLDTAYMKPELRVYTFPKATTEIGIQNMKIEVLDTCSGRHLQDTTCNQAAIEFSSWTADSWASDLHLIGFNRFIDIKKGASRITIQDIIMNRNKDIFGAALPLDIFIQGHQVLVQDCQQVGIQKARSFSISTDSLTPGPNAVLRHHTNSSIQTLSPHERWSWGLLIEETTAPTLVENRGNKGTGQGWTMNAAVGWNLRTNVTFQSPPLGINWCVGCGRLGGPLGNATFIHSGANVRPRSLFLAQLKARGIQWSGRGADS